MTMGNIGACPECTAPLDKVLIEYLGVEIAGKLIPGAGFSCLCPACHYVLSVQVNPLKLPKRTPP